MNREMELRYEARMDELDEQDERDEMDEEEGVALLTECCLKVSGHIVDHLVRNATWFNVWDDGTIQVKDRRGVPCTIKPQGKGFMLGWMSENHIMTKDALAPLGVVLRSIRAKQERIAEKTAHARLERQQEEAAYLAKMRR